jgi:hypothetical protein
MPVSAPSESSIARSAPQRTIRPVPKPGARRARYVGQHAQRRLTDVQGHAFRDISADVVARQALSVAKAVDARRDPLIVKMTRLFMAIRHDVNTSAASRAMATEGEACGHEAIRLDAIVAEHEHRAEQGIETSIEAGQAVAGGIDDVLTGYEP